MPRLSADPVMITPTDLSADPVMITPADEQVLTRLVRAHGTPQKLSERAQMILLAAGGTSVRQIARQLGVWPKTVRHWLHRWRTAAVPLPTAKIGAMAVAQRLADAPRTGTPATFTPEQICAIIALACEQPAAESNLPLSHWSRSELARCAVERGIVNGISNSSVGRFFKRSRASAASGAGLAHPSRRVLARPSQILTSRPNARTSARPTCKRLPWRNRVAGQCRLTR
jgi:transposase